MPSAHQVLQKAASVIPHPYFPTSLHLPHYTVPTMTMTTILTIFFAAVFGILGVSWILISRRKNASTSTKFLFLWFVACGFIHSVLEGYFAYNHKTIAGQSHVLAELWKEYAYSDSRYMSGDPFIVVMESVTSALWGPFSFLVAYFMYIDSPAAPILSFLVSLGQLYGDILYYATTLIEGAPHCSPSPFHYWFYFVHMNAYWIVIPLYVMWRSGKEMYRGVAALKKTKTKTL
ncbi:hypothetical protein HDU85_004406 [Gaertneriomyces sp. JEL0708]|nr:hypothetical protein HDU85_004406 [Gaertneriomyces sp. JEL0708]